MEFSELIQNRFSVRKFSDLKVESEAIEKILKAGQAAPTACNRQPQRIFVIESEEGLGRPKKDEQRDKRQAYLDQNERIEVERQFSLAKRKCNLGKVKTKLEETVGFTLAMSIVVLNLRKLQHTLSSLLLQILRLLWPHKKLAFVQ